MRNRVQVAMSKIKENGGIAALQECPDLNKRYEKLTELLPEIKNWDIPIARQQLYFSIHRFLNIDLNVCEHFQMDDHRQYCFFGGRKEECRCVIPQTFCVVRGQKG